MRRALVLVVAASVLVVPAAASAVAPVSGGTKRTLEPSSNMVWQSRHGFRPNAHVIVSMRVDDVVTSVRGRLPLRFSQEIADVTWQVRSPLYPNGKRRLMLRAGNGRAAPVEVQLSWHRICGGYPCVAPIP